MFIFLVPFGFCFVILLCTLSHRLSVAKQEKRAEVAAIMEREAAQAARKRKAEADRKAAEDTARIRKEEASAKQKAKEEAQAAKAEARKAIQAEKLAAARELAEYNERALAAARELKAIQDAMKAEEARKPEPIQETAPEPVRPYMVPATGPESPQPFAGETVSFTGKLQSMKRAEAIARVKAAGGRAFADYPAGTTILVVGSNPGMQKLDKFDRWIGQTRKITEAQFLEMLAGA